MGFSRQEYWNVLPFPSPGDLPDPGIKPVSPELAVRFFVTEPSLYGNIYKPSLRGHWDSLGPGTLCCSAAVFAPGHTSPWATEHKRTVCVCMLSLSLFHLRLEVTRLLCPWNFPGKNTGVGCHFLFLGVFPTQGSTQENPASSAPAGGFFTYWGTWEEHKEIIWAKKNKKACMSVQLGQILDKWYKETKKNNCHFWSKSRVLPMLSAYNTIQGVDKPPTSYSSSPIPRHTPPSPA